MGRGEGDCEVREGARMAAAAYGSGRERRGSRAGDEWCAGESGWMWVGERMDVGSIYRGRLRFHRAGAIRVRDLYWFDIFVI